MTKQNTLADRLPYALSLVVCLAWACGGCGVTDAVKRFFASDDAPALIVPTSHGLMAVWGSGARDVWFAGGEGTVLHFDGRSLSLVPSGTRNNLLAVHGTGPKDVWFAGAEGTTLRWNGAAISAEKSLPDTALLGVFAKSPTEVWMVGINRPNSVGYVRYWNGKVWEDQPVPKSSSVWEIGLVGDELWLVGTSTSTTGLVLRAKGVQISELAFAGNSLRGVWGTAIDDAWVQPYGAPAQHWDGRAWSSANAVSERAQLSIWGSGKNDVWTVGLAGTILHYDGKRWSLSRSGVSQDLLSVWGSGPNDVWAVGAQGTILRFDGKIWHKLPLAAAH